MDTLKTNVLYYGDNLDILRKYPKIQILTIEELLQGKKVEMPPTSIEFLPKAPRISKKQGEQITMEGT